MTLKENFSLQGKHLQNGYWDILILRYLIPTPNT